jgi:hypothetical protein
LFFLVSWRVRRRRAGLAPQMRYGPARPLRCRTPGRGRKCESHSRPENRHRTEEEATVWSRGLAPTPNCYVDGGTYSPLPTEVGPACGRWEKCDGFRTEITDAVYRSPRRSDTLYSIATSSSS